MVENVTIDSISLGERLRLAREEVGLTLSQATKRAGLSNNAVIDRWEKGEREPRLSDLRKLAKAYGKQLIYSFEDMGVPDLFVSVERPTISHSVRPGDVFSRLDQIINETPDERQLLYKIAEEISNTVQVAIIAVFEYRWASGELHKNREYIAPRFQPTPEPFEEKYSV